MRKLIKNLLIFLLPFIVAIIIIEVAISYSRSRLLSEKNLGRSLEYISYPYQWVNKVTHPNKILLLGSSSVRYDLSCSLLNKLSGDSLSFINLGMDARDPIETYFILTHLDLTNVKAVYIGLDPWVYTKAYYRYRNSNLYFDFSLPQVVNYFFEYDKDIFRKRITGLFSYYKKNYRPEKYNYSAMQVDTIPADFGSKKLDRVASNFKNIPKDEFEISKYGWSEIQFVYLMKIAALCKDNHIAFNAFLPPKGAAYCEYYRAHYLGVNDDFIRNLKSVGFNAPVYGTFDQLKKYNQGEIFIEHYHLNFKGQELYSQIFFQMIQNKKVADFDARPWLGNE